MTIRLGADSPCRRDGAGPKPGGGKTLAVADKLASEKRVGCFFIFSSIRSCTAYEISLSFLPNLRKASLSRELCIDWLSMPLF